MKRMKLYQFKVTGPLAVGAVDVELDVQDALTRNGFEVGTSFIESTVENLEKGFIEIFGKIEVDESIETKQWGARNWLIFGIRNSAVSIQKLDWKFGDYEAFYEMANVNSYALALLGSTLVKMEEEEEPQPSYETSDHTFYFLTDAKAPVMTKRGFLNELKPTGRYWYSVQTGEEVEVARAENIGQAIEFAAIEMLKWKMRNVGESLYFQKQFKMEAYI